MDARPVHHPRGLVAVWARLRPSAARAGRAGDLVRGELRPGGSEREWCEPEVLQRLRRASLRDAPQGGSSRPAARSFLPEWQGVDRAPPGGTGVDRLREMLVPLQGLALAPGSGSATLLPRRVGAYSPAWMNQLCASGRLVWVGAGALGLARGTRGAPLPRGRALRRPAALQGTEPVGAGARRDPRAARAGRGLLDRPPGGRRLGRARRAQEALWDLAWAGEVTNDAFAPLRAPKLSVARRGGGALRTPPAAGGAAGTQGRWSLTRSAVRGRAVAWPADATISELLLERHSICRPSWPRDPGGFAGLYSELANLETLGTARRQVLRRGPRRSAVRPAAAIERLRGLRTDEPAGALVLAATDPANPAGATLPWPKRDDDDSNRRPASARRLRGLTRLGAGPLRQARRQGAARPEEPDEEWLGEALEALARGPSGAAAFRGSGVERFDGKPVVGSRWAPV